ncbi:hypothetical protein JD969_02175 [Planctomycetota bacterium]|nr:hypothetical protein JD969_02175 [Planctomycetota bacterium]
MHKRNKTIAFVLFLPLLVAVWVQSISQPIYAESPENKPAVAPSQLLLQVLEDPINTSKDMRRLALFHGRYDLLTDKQLSATEAAQVALIKFDLQHPALSDPNTPVTLRAKAALFRGEPDQTIKLINDPKSIIEKHLFAQAQLDLGQTTNAIRTLQSIRKIAGERKLLSPANMIAAAESLVLLARLEGRPAQDWQLALDMLTKSHQEVDPLYWPAYIAEAKLLYMKDNRPEAIDALMTALSFNIEASEAWYYLGLMSGESFDFDRAFDAASRLRANAPTNPLAAIVETRAYMTQRDHKRARSVVKEALEVFPTNRQLIAIKAATHACSFEAADYQLTIRKLDRLMPNSHMGYLEAGRYLSLDRQYGLSESALKKAVTRLPNDSEPVIELGLLQIQDGKLEDAHRALTRAVQLDPFNRRAVNSLQLVQDLLTYETIETDHFIIRYKAGIDHVLANDMAQQVEKIYDAVTGFYRHKPTRKTQIDILPDEEYFGVRITGMPEIWTVAAATGDVIALTPPRSGAKQRGAYDWYNVIQHEFTHTVTLSLTNNRIPHWLTEACAVELEIAERDFETCKLLAWALNEEKLFEYENINWGFVRPKTDYDRSLAYAQANWMLQYIIEKYSHQKMLDLLALYGKGISDRDGLKRVTGLSTTEFMTNFKTWAQDEIEEWGLMPLPSDQKAMNAEALKEMSADGLRDQLKKTPDNPLVIHTLSTQIHKKIKELRGYPTLKSIEQQHELEEELAALLDHYEKLRPIDSWPARLQAELALSSSTSMQLIESLKQLDSTEQTRGDWAFKLSKLFRKKSNYPEAYTYIFRALHREPFNPAYRQLAAALAIQNKKLDEAEHHLNMMTYLEPRQSVHHLRMAAFFKKTGKMRKALESVKQAQKLNPNVDITPYLE